MKLLLTGNGNSNPIPLVANADDFKVSIIGIAKGGFDGKWTVEYSPNGNDWLAHEQMTDLIDSEAGNIFFQVPSVRINVKDMTTGSLEVYAYGSVG